MPLLLSSTAFAGNHQIGFGIGGGSTDGPNDWSDSGFAGKIDYAYQFHPNFAAEIGYAGVAGMTSNIVTTVLGTTKQEVQYSTGFVGLKAGVSPVSFLNLYVVGGANYSDVEKTYTPSGGTERTDSYRVTSILWSGYRTGFFSTVGLNLEYRKFVLADDFESDVVFAGMNIKF